MLDLVNLGKHKKHMPNQMSGGQQQRVGVARALVVDPKIIFADEPTGNLDSHTSEEVMKLMQQVVRQQKKTLVMVTHDNHLATYADRVFHISDGKIIKIENHRKNEANKEERKMSRTRRMMAVVVAALLIAAMILPGLAVKAEAAEEPEEKPKVEVSLVGDNQTFEAGETKTLTVQITNNSGQELNNVEVKPDMSKKKAGDWPFEKDWKQYSEKIDGVVANGKSKSVSFDFTRREGAKRNSYTIPFSVYVQGIDGAIVTDSIFVYAKNETVTPEPTPGDNSQNQGDAGNGSAAGSGSDSADMNVTADDGAVAYSGGGSGSGGSSSDGSVPRVIVTGFDTNPAEVHAGSDFYTDDSFEKYIEENKSPEYVV